MFGEHGTPSSRKGLCISLRKNRGKSFWILGIPPLPPHSLALRASRILGFILTGSLCTTKSERILSKILMPTNLRASSAPCGRGSKNQKFSFLISDFRLGVGGADKKWKGNFWFCFAATISILYFITSLCQGTTLAILENNNYV